MNLPLWLEDEIRTESLSICDWACGEGERVDALRARFPQSRVRGIDQSHEALRKARQKFGAEYFIHHDVLAAPLPFRFDVLASFHVLQSFEAPWAVLGKLAMHAVRHLVVLVPFGGTRDPEQRYTFLDSTIGTRIAPDFILSSSKIIEAEGSDPQILLVYSRQAFFPRASTTFERGPLAWPEPLPSSGSPRHAAVLNEAVNGELARLTGLLEKREAEQAALEADVEYWRAKAEALAKRLEQPQAREAESQAGLAEPLETPAAGDPIDDIIVPEIRRAESLAFIQCAIAFSSALNQRPISYARYVADRGSTVLFLEVWNTPEADVHRAGAGVYPGIFTVPFYPFDYKIRDTFQDNLDRITAGLDGDRRKKLYLCTLPMAGVKDVLRPLRAAGFHIHYDIMDDWEEFHRGGEAHWYSVAVERDMVLFADTVSAVSDKLAQKFRRIREDVAVVRNGYRPAALGCEQFIAARTPASSPKIMGYFGHFSDAWFDWDTVFYAAQQRPNIEFELIGYGISESARARLSEFPNIRFVGLVPQKNLHQYASKWWAGMIPFQPSEVSAAVDPLKVYEYLHLGLHSVVTGISGIAEFPMVHYAGSAEGFVQAMDQLPDRAEEHRLPEVAEFLKACEWDARWARLTALIYPEEPEF